MRRFALPWVFLAALLFLSPPAQALDANDRPHSLVQQVYEAIRANDTEKLRKLLVKRPELLQRISQPSFETLIMASSAATYGCLLDLGLAVNTKDFGGRTALHWAVIKSDAGLVAMLLNRGATVDLLDSAEATPLMYACAMADSALMQTLLDHGADPSRKDRLGNTLAHFAAMARYDSTVMETLANRHFDFNATNQAGQTPLMVACSEPPHAYFPTAPVSGAAISPKQPIVTFLVAHGADLNAVDLEQTPILIYAVRSNNLDLTRRCIDSGAEINVKRVGLTPLDLALLQRDSAELVECLASRGAIAPYTDRAGNNHLHMRVAYHFLTSPPTDPAGTPAPGSAASPASSCDPVVPVLLKYGFDVRATNADGETALHRACEGVNYDSVVTLLDFHADPNTATPGGLRPLDIAVGKRDLDIIRLLLARGADPGRTDAAGETPLHRLLTEGVPEEVLSRLVVPTSGKLNKYQQEVHLLYDAQRTVPNGVAWGASLLFLIGLADALRRRNLRRTISAAAEMELEIPANSVMAEPALGSATALTGSGVLAAPAVSVPDSPRETAESREIAARRTGASPVAASGPTPLVNTPPGSGTGGAAGTSTQPEPLAHDGELPAAVWKSANWKQLAAGATAARVLTAKRMRVRTWFFLPLLAWVFAAILYRYDPVWYNVLDTVTALSLSAPTVLALLAWMALALRPRWLRTLIQPVAWSATLVSISVLAWQAIVLGVECRFVAVGALLGCLALIHALALVVLFRLFWIDRAIRALNLPFEISSAPPPPPEAEEIESHHGWDETQKV